MDSSETEEKTITVVGAVGGMGDVAKMAVSHALRKNNVRVRAVVRSADILNPEDIGHERLTVIEADPAKDRGSLVRAITGASSVISCVGNRQPFFERWGAAGMSNITEAMKTAGVGRLVCISSMGIGDSWKVMNTNKFGKIMGCLFMTLCRSSFRDLTKAETITENSGLDYLIVRPTGLSPEAPVYGEWLTQDCGPEGPKKLVTNIEISKADCAQFMLEEALAPTMHRKSVIVGAPPNRSS